MDTSLCIRSQSYSCCNDQIRKSIIKNKKEKLHQCALDSEHKGKHVCGCGEIHWYSKIKKPKRQTTTNLINKINKLKIDNKIKDELILALKELQEERSFGNNEIK